MYDLNKYSFCISNNLKKYEILCYNFKQHGIIPPTLIPGVEIQKNKYIETKEYSHLLACKLAHFNAIFLAKSLDFPYVIIFEDDAYPCQNIIEKFNELISNINDVNYDILLLGIAGESTNYSWNNLEGYSYQNIKEKTKVNFFKDYLTIPNNLHGAHAYLINKRSYDKYLNLSISNKTSSDFLLTQQFFGNKIIVSKKLLFIQKNLDGSLVYPIFYDNEELSFGPFNYNISKYPKGF